MKISKLFPYPGGKHFLVKILLLCLPSYKRYLEVFGGGGSLLFAMPAKKGVVEILNDADPDVANIYSQFIENYKLFRRRVNQLPRSSITGEEYLRSYVDRAAWHDLDAFERAYRHWFLLKVCVSSHIRRTGSTISRQKLMALYSKISLRSQHNRLKDVNIDNLDFRIAIQRYVNKNTFLYADPPYYKPKEDMYAHGLTRRDHIALAAHLHACKGKVLVSYDDVPAVRKLYEGWNMVSIPWTYMTSTAGPTDGQELLIANYPLKHKSISKLLERKVEYIAGRTAT